MMNCMFVASRAAICGRRAEKTWAREQAEGDSN